MGSWVLVSMELTCPVLVCMVVMVVIGVESTEEQDAPYSWSALSFLSSQNNNKRSADDSKESSLSEADDMFGSESKIEAAALIASEPDPESRMNPYRRRKNKYRTKKRKNKYAASVPSQDFYEDKIYDDTYYDRDSSYSAPTSGGGGDSFNDFLNALAAFLPIGLFLAAIPPNLIVINSRRKRQAEDEMYNTLESSYPFMDKINTMGFSRLSETDCQKELFCEMAEMGSNQEANTVQKLFAYAVSLTPDILADMVGVKDVFEATREGRCRKFKCQY